MSKDSYLFQSIKQRDDFFDLDENKKFLQKDLIVSMQIGEHVEIHKWNGLQWVDKFGPWEFDQPIPTLCINALSDSNEYVESSYLKFTVTDPPQNKWIVTIPKGGEFHVHMTSDINWWQRAWMKFIGWGVERNESLNKFSESNE